VQIPPAVFLILLPHFPAPLKRPASCAFAVVAFNRILIPIRRTKLFKAEFHHCTILLELTRILQARTVTSLRAITQPGAKQDHKVFARLSQSNLNRASQPATRD
jgi:hypothetical protein